LNIEDEDFCDIIIKDDCRESRMNW